MESDEYKEMARLAWEASAKSPEEAEAGVDRIIVEAAKRAKVLFDTFNLQWVTEESRNKPREEHESEVPSLELITERLRKYVKTLREHGFSRHGGGRLCAIGDWEHTGGEEAELQDIRLLFELGSIPIHYLYENVLITAKMIEEENKGAK